MSESIKTWFEENPAEAKHVMNKVVEAAVAREAARKARDLTRTKKTQIMLNGKLANCSEKNPEKCEVYVFAESYKFIEVAGEEVFSSPYFTTFAPGEYGFLITDRGVIDARGGSLSEIGGSPFNFIDIKRHWEEFADNFLTTRGGFEPVFQRLANPLNQRSATISAPAAEPTGNLGPANDPILLKQITLELPDELISLCGSVGAVAERAKQVLVLDVLRRRQISAGKAAELLGISLWDLHELMAEHQIPMVEMSEEELREELKTAERVLGGNAK
jgi:predicted HTH domain antitoxin